MIETFKVLVIDDETLIRKSICLVSKGRGHEVLSATDGKTAIKNWLEFHPDLIFLDLLLPDINGLDLLKKIPSNLRATCVIISAHDQLSVEKVKESGADLFIQKPFADIFQTMVDLESLVLSKKETYENY